MSTPTAKPVVIGDVVLSNGSQAVLAGNFTNLGSTYYGFDQLQVAILPNSTPVTLNQTTGLSFPAGESPNNGFQNPTVGGGSIAAIPTGGMAIVTWGGTNLNYDLQILNNSGAVTRTPFAIASQFTTPGNNSFYGANPDAVVKAWSGGLVVGWSTDDIQNTYFERFSLSGVASGQIVHVASVPNASTNWFGSMAVDSSGNVIFGFGSSDIYHPGSYKEFNSAGTLIGSGTVAGNEVAPQFAALPGGGFITAGYTPVGPYNQQTGVWASFTLNIQKVSGTTGALSTVDTVPNAIVLGASNLYGVNWIDTVTPTSVEFIEGNATTTADSYNLSTGTLSRNSVSLPALPFAVSPTAGTQGTVLGVGVNGSNQLVAETAVPCYCRGTLIDTDKGHTAVEDLAIGDLVVTKSGAARPIKWIGRRSYGGRFLLGHKHILPICFKAGCLDDNLPRRDLWISPHHAMYLEGVLIEACDLVNGVTIVQPDDTARVEYFHVELDTHDVIIAEGALSETFIDDDSRAMFHNAHEYRLLYQEAATIERRYCAPRLDEGYQIEAARRKIALRAGLRTELETHRSALRGYVDVVSPRRIAGWAQSVAHPNAPVCLDILAGGQLIGQTLANSYREDLALAGFGNGHHGFSFVLPLDLRFAPRAIEVRRSLDGATLPQLTEVQRAIANARSRDGQSKAAGRR